MLPAKSFLLTTLLLCCLTTTVSAAADEENVGKGQETLLPQQHVPSVNGTFAQQNALLQPRAKRDTVAKVKTAAVALFAFFGASIVFGLDYAITTIFTPLMIITLTKNIELKEIFETCNHRRKAHLANRDGSQNWLKALFCVPTDDEDKIHKRRFFLDVMKTAFRHIQPNTMALIRAEHARYKKATEYMDRSADWNAPKMTRSILVFLENYDLVEHRNLPKDMFSKEEVAGAEEASENALDELREVDPAFVKEELEKEKLYADKEDPELAMGIGRKLDELDVIMEQAHEKVTEEYKRKSINYKLRQKLTMVANFMRKMARRYVAGKDEEKEGEKKKNKDEEEDEKKEENPAKIPDNLSIWEKASKYGLLNYQVIDQTFLEQVKTDLCNAKSSLIRMPFGDGKKRAWQTMLDRIGEFVEVNVFKQKATVEQQQLTVVNKPEKEGVEEKEKKKGSQQQQLFHLDPVMLSNYPKLFQQIIQMAFDQEWAEAKQLDIVQLIGQDKVRFKLADMPVDIRRMYIQRGIARIVIYFLKELLSAQNSDDGGHIQKYFVAKFAQRKELTDLFKQLRSDCQENLSKALRTEVFKQMEAKGAFKEQQALLARDWLYEKLREWWVEQMPRRSEQLMDQELGAICKKLGADWFGLGRPIYKTEEECQNRAHMPLLELHKNFLKLSNQFKISKSKPISSSSIDAKALDESEQITAHEEQKLEDILKELIGKQRAHFKQMLAHDFEPQSVSVADDDQLPVAKGEPASKNENQQQQQQHGVPVHARRRKRFAGSIVLTNILRTSAWMQLFKLFNVVEIVRDCIVRSINYQQWRCEVPPLIKAEQNFVYKLKRILMEGLSCAAVPEIRRLYDDFVRRHMAGQKRPSPSELLAQAELVIPYRWEQVLDDFSSEAWEQFGKCRG